MSEIEEENNTSVKELKSQCEKVRGNKHPLYEETWADYADRNGITYNPDEEKSCRSYLDSYEKWYYAEPEKQNENNNSGGGSGQQGNGDSGQQEGANQNNEDQNTESNENKNSENDNHSANRDNNHNVSNNNKKTEELSDGTIITYFENGNIESQHNPDGSFIENYETGNLRKKGDKESVFLYSEQGKLEYKVENGKLWYDPAVYSYIKIGMKTKDNENHWTEDITLNPQKKTLIVYGGMGTNSGRAGNGNLNSNINALGFTEEQKNNMQMLAHYYHVNDEITWIFEHYGDKITNWDELKKEDCNRKLSKVFQPFIATKTNQGLQKLSSSELLNNMRNILSATHCYGTNEMVKIEDVFFKTMQTLGYDQELIDRALKQNLCITNNSQREFTDHMKTTTIHRYSVCDGQQQKKYDYDVTNSYPAMLEKSPKFKEMKGDKSSFIPLNKNEVMMAFDKVLSDSTKNSHEEHEKAFFTTDQEKLTDVGKKQMKLIQSVGQYWYHNHDEMPDAENLVRQCGENAGLELWTTKSIVSGKLLQKELNNPLKNPHVLDVAINRFNNPNIETEHTGIWTLLQARKQQKISPEVMQAYQEKKLLESKR